MKFTALLLPSALLFPLVLSGCGENTPSLSDIEQKIQDIDVSKLSVDGMKTKASELVGTLGSELKSIKDTETAKTIADKVQPLLGTLEKLKSALGEKMPDMAQLKEHAQDLKERFGSKQAILDVLKPVIAQLEKLAK